jgi:hypothetical protein
MKISSHNVKIFSLQIFVSSSNNLSSFLKYKIKSLYNIDIRLFLNLLSQLARKPLYMKLINITLKEFFMGLFSFLFGTDDDSRDDDTDHDKDSFSNIFGSPDSSCKDDDLASGNYKENDWYD